MSNTFKNIIEKSRQREIRSLTGMGLTLEDAKDVFQEASVALYDVVNSQRLTMRSTPEAYLHGICYNMAHKRLDELRKTADLADDDKVDRLLSLTEEAEETLYDDSEGTIDYQSILMELLERLSPRDYSIIHGFYIEGKSLEALSVENDLASMEVARTTKCRIMNRLRQQAEERLKKYF